MARPLIAFVAIALASAMVTQVPVHPPDVIVPLVNALRADSTVGLQDQPMDSTIIEVGSLMTGLADSLIDSVRAATKLRLAVRDNVACAVGDEPSSVAARATCALRVAPHYVEINHFVVADNHARASVFVCRRAPPIHFNRGWRRNLGSTIASIFGRGVVRSDPIAFQTYVAALARSDSNTWQVVDLRAAVSAP